MSRSNPYIFEITEFTVGTDDFSKLEIRDSNANNFHYFYDTQHSRLIKHFVLEEKPQVETLCEVTLIKKGERFAPRLRLWKRNKVTKKQAELKVDDSKQQYRSIKSAVSLDDCHENFWSLINYLQGVQNIDIPPQAFSVVATINSDFVQKVVTSFQTPEEQQLLIDAKEEDVRNLHAAINHAKNKHALAEIEKLIKDDVTEAYFQKWFETNTWAFGIDYLSIYKTSRIGIHSDSDFIAKSLDQYVDLIELKRPNMVLLTYDQSHDSYYPSGDLSKAIGPSVAYLHTMENSKNELQEKD